MDASDPDPLKTEELTEVIREIRERVRARYPESSAAGIALPDLFPVVHARDAAGAKVASIGTVNPRPPGIFNNLVQRSKRLVARALDWHVREQVEFNRGVMTAVEAILEALNENNRALARLAHADAEAEARSEQRLDELGESVAQRLDAIAMRLEDLRNEAVGLRKEAVELKDVRTHWAQWRQEWEHKLSVNEMQFLRATADLQSAFQYRVTQIESNFRDMVRTQHADFTGAVDRSGLDIQKRLWEDLHKVRAEFEKLIHTELRLIRQRASLPAVEPTPLASYISPPVLDYARFAERFRGSEQYVAEKQALYLPLFQDCTDVLDIGCGRGEFLALMKEKGVSARGVDLSAESVAFCRSRGLQVESGDFFTCFGDVPDATVGGIFCAQVVEHIAPDRIPELVRLAAAKLVRGAPLVIETPNPECLAIFATHFYLDPTHTRPVPSTLLRFYMEESGIGQIEVRPLSPAVETMPVLATLPEDFRNAFFGGLDYAIIGRKL